MVLTCISIPLVRASISPELCGPVGGQDLVECTAALDSPSLQQQSARATTLQGGSTVLCDNNDVRPINQHLQASARFVDKGFVARRDPFVHEYDVGRNARCDGEEQPERHSARICSNRQF